MLGFMCEVTVPLRDLLTIISWQDELFSRLGLFHFIFFPEKL